MSMGLIIVNI